MAQALVLLPSFMQKVTNDTDEKIAEEKDLIADSIKLNRQNIVESAKPPLARKW